MFHHGNDKRRRTEKKQLLDVNGYPQRITNSQIHGIYGADHFSRVWSHL
jgi:hypothetical protein